MSLGPDQLSFSMIQKIRESDFMSKGRITVQLTGNVAGTHTTRYASMREIREGAGMLWGIASKTFWSEYSLRYSGNSLSLDPWGCARSIDCNLRLRKMSPAIFFLFSHAQIMQVRKPGNIPHCQTSGDSICPCWGPCRLQNSSLGQLENMIRATSGATSPGKSCVDG